MNRLSTIPDIEARRARRAARARQDGARWEAHEGTVADLRPGDFVDTLGSIGDVGPGYRRYRVQAAVAYARFQADARFHLAFQGCDRFPGDFVAVPSYPVSYRRKEA